MNLLSADTNRFQIALGNYCRTAEEPALPGITTGRLPHYRRLVFNVIKDSLESTYPLTHELLEPSEWDELVFRFFAEHRCQSPQIWSMPYELITWMEEHEHTLFARYPHLHDLLRFEWSEVEVYMQEDAQLPAFSGDGDWLNDIILINPEHQLLQLSYPVHLKNPRLIGTHAPSEYFCLIYREPLTGKALFINLTSYCAWLIDTLSRRQITLHALFEETGMLLPDHGTASLALQTVAFLEEMQKKSLVLGFIK